MLLMLIYLPSEVKLNAELEFVNQTSQLILSLIFGLQSQTSVAEAE